ncbi:PREDICTED: phosphatidylglycerol/phosphatidylinositol transfer protein-like [Amphimedon queenslandica]|uniref:MD-2-related lipid-recognition domain-containing protein n=1 Tax=Amphimedon queenslandica TaxID=400682 RepID=A0AAN0JNY3_AMPQE|nr:PREDICTED: phosphatidylglycerol/phosphatidylinositol transfer protein-like [Amphimedon queenslandica]|eukprot:XP_019858522.1 PREDICTED: phosphatidylglycerol/phosphatidylinositol transfer protein-like [Amphimedon queenslandica]
MGRLVEYILLLLSVVLVVSTLTESTNNYYNEPTGNKGVTDCSATKKIFEFFNASLTSYTLKKGDSIQLHADLQIKRTIQGGILHVTMTQKFKNYVNITFIDEKFNLCDFFVDLMNIHCPIQPGMYHLYYHAQIPNLFWPGMYYAKATAHNEKGEEMMCLMTEINYIA